MVRISKHLRPANKTVSGIGLLKKEDKGHLPIKKIKHGDDHEGQKGGYRREERRESRR